MTVNHSFIFPITYCTFLVLLGTYVIFTGFQLEVVSISFDQDSLISFSFALFELTVVILFIPVLMSASINVSLLM